MIGLPTSYNSKQDYYNGVDYTNQTGLGKSAIRDALMDLKTNVYMLVLKPSSAKKPAEKQTPEDFEKVLNPNCKKNQLGFTDSEIDILLQKLK